MYLYVIPVTCLCMAVSLYCSDPVPGKLVKNPNAISQIYRYLMPISFRLWPFSLWFLKLPVCGPDVVVLFKVWRECIPYALQLRHN